jgi:hypothetical protein
MATMALLTEYRGRLLNHVELLYQRGERDLAVAFFEALGCRVVATDRAIETGSTILCVYPEPGECDIVNNVLYLSEVRDVQWELERALAAAVEHDAALADAVTAFRHKAATKPHGNPHFGLRYPSFASLEAVVDRLQHDLDPRLADRVSVCVVRPLDSQSMTEALIQAFVATDLVTAGLFATGQLIELQAQELGG